MNVRNPFRTIKNKHFKFSVKKPKSSLSVSEWTLCNTVLVLQLLKIMEITLVFLRSNANVELLLIKKNLKTSTVDNGALQKRIKYINYLFILLNKQAIKYM